MLYTRMRQEFVLCSGGRARMQVEQASPLALAGWQCLHLSDCLPVVLLPQLAYLGVTFLGATMLMRWAMSQMDPNKDSKKRGALCYGEMLRCFIFSCQAELCLLCTPPTKLAGAGKDIEGLVAGCGKEEGDTAQDRQAS